jgi:acid phosphatase family membrane protein YuiD
LEFREFIEELAYNHVLWVTLFSWFVASTLKVAFNYMKEKKINFRRFVGSGGMPSTHSALVSALATAVGFETGWNSVFTAMAIIFAFIVMYDAAGVRLAASRQAVTLNKIIDELFEEGEFRQDRLKELLGHTPIEVIAGAVLGVVIAIIFA